MRTARIAHRVKDIKETSHYIMTEGWIELLSAQFPSLSFKELMVLVQSV